MLIKKEIRKSFKIRTSGRSTDFISPSFGFGCLLDCTYCYMKRHTDDNSVSIATNPNEILTAINNHVTFLPNKIPNQTDPVYYTYDIACNEDFALHSKYHKWKYIFTFFKNHPKAKASLATKIIPYNFLNFNPNKKVRIRFSLMPDRIKEVLEPNTPKTIDKLLSINKFIKAGYDVHLNFSPIVVYKKWLQDYEELFKLIDEIIIDKNIVKAECIFLTHNKDKHIKNLIKSRTGENYIWREELQESKKSEFGGNNIRYRLDYKEKYIELFKNLHNKYISWNTIRYIF